MSDIQGGLARWGLDVGQVRERVYRAATPRERERWHALWLLAQGWSANSVAAALARDAHTIGGWLTDFCEHGPTALAFEHVGGSPPPSTRMPGLAWKWRCRPPRPRSASPWRTGTGRWSGSSSRRAAAGASAGRRVCGICTGWASSTSARRSACSRPTRRSARPLSSSTRRCSGKPRRPGRRSSSRTRRISAPMRTSTGSGCSRAGPPWSIPVARAGARRPATTRRSAWRRARRRIGSWWGPARRPRASRSRRNYARTMPGHASLSGTTARRTAARRCGATWRRRT